MAKESGKYRSQASSLCCKRGSIEECEKKAGEPQRASHSKTFIVSFNSFILFLR
jgi:hypothetical protein